MRYPIMWHEGMPLEPAVFQQSDLNKAKTLRYLLSIHQHSWGITKLEINDTYLAEGIFSIKTLECCLSDYTPIEFIASDSENLSINLKERVEDFKINNMFVFLTLPDNNLSYQTSVAKPRYIPKEIEGIKDLNNLDSETRISFLKPAIGLMLSETPPIGYISIPLAKIKFTGISYQLVEYCAPILKIKNNPFLTAKLEQMVNTGRDKLKYLMNKTEENIATKFAIMNLSSIIFPIEHILKSNESPYLLFKHLIESIAHALPFFNDNNVPTINAYNHLDHLSSILPLLNFMNAALDSIKESYKATQFQQKDGIFATMLQNTPDKVIDKVIIGLIKKANKDIDTLIKWASNAIITSEDKITLMQDQRLVGAKREFIKYSDKLELKNTQDMILLEVSLDKAYISQNKMLCIMNLDIENAPDSINLFFEN